MPRSALPTYQRNKPTPSAVQITSIAKATSPQPYARLIRGLPRSVYASDRLSFRLKYQAPIRTPPGQGPRYSGDRSSSGTVLPRAPMATAPKKPATKGIQAKPDPVRRPRAMLRSMPAWHTRMSRRCRWVRRTAIGHAPSIADVGGCAQRASQPPSTTNSVPVMNEASSEARKRTALATSIGSPVRRKGVWRMISAIASGLRSRPERIGGM